MINHTIYTVGGTVQAGGGVYIPRKADEELLGYCRTGDFAFILSSRQVGKSSLMVRTARQLERENIRSVIIDLSSIGVKISADEWYLGILDEISTTLKLKTDIFAWWSGRAGLGPAQRLTNFFRDVLLKEVTEPIVLFFDEIDSTLSIPFADDFFASLRAIYNARSTVADFKRLSFVLVGVATPGDLIADSKRTPFNIGHRVELTDFTLEEAAPLAGGMGVQTLSWVFHWTSGHPYLTQRLCAHLSKSMQGDKNRVIITEDSVIEAVIQLFEGEQGRQDNNLQFVRDMLTKRSPDIQRVLKTYKDICLGKKVSDDERSIPKAHLKISGVIRRHNTGELLRRNRIYERTFDLKWIKENTPLTTARKFVIVSSIITIIALLTAGYFVWQDYNRTPAERAVQFTNDFQSARSPNARLKNLAGLFELNDEIHNRNARQLFNELSQQNKLALFAPSTSWGASEDQAIIVKGLYQHMGNTEDENMLLEVMAKAAPSLADEITFWLAGRKELNEKDYYSAEANIGLAITKNRENPALYFDRAQAYIGLGKDYYPKAFNDLNTMVQLDKNRGSDAYRLINLKPLVSYYWKVHALDAEYKALADAVTIPMVLIPEGEFMMGSTPEQVDQAMADCQKQNNNKCLPGLRDDQKPQHKVYLDSYYIDQYEVTNARYAECVIAGVCQLPQYKGSYTHESYYGNAEFDNYPVIYVSWFDASTYCQWRGARLPTEAEWEKAASWNDLTQEKYIYPWGNDFNGSLVNICDINCIWDWANKNYDDGYADISPMGNYPDGVSPYGVYDMAGNVWEWVNDWYQSDYYATLGDNLSNPQGPSNGDTRALRGGAWDGIRTNVRSADRNHVDPTSTSLSLGFRCARSLP